MGERAGLEAVLFDAGGTLVRLDYEWMAGEVTWLGAALDPVTLRRAEIAGRRRYDASRGHAPGENPGPLGATGDTRSYFAGMLEAAGVPPAVVEAALLRFFARHEAAGLWTRPMEGAREALDALGEMGLRRAVISNSDGRAEMHLGDCGMLRGIEFVVDSHAVGVEKPAPAIFRIALERLGLSPNDALFVGDIRSVDEAGARAVGTHFVLLDPYGDYASPGEPAIEGMHGLAAWVAEHFELPARRRTGTLRS
jgi:putative hydrolase of the HAD superfamily